MSTRIYDKTDKGREEIATRKYQVPAKLRMLLVVIDGRQTLESLLNNFAVLGLSKADVDTLAQQGLIALAGAAAEPEPAPAPPPRSPGPARARQQARSAARQERPPQPEVPAPVPGPEQAAADDQPPATRRNFFDYFNLASDAVNFSES